MTAPLQRKHRRDGKPRIHYTDEAYIDALDCIWTYVSGLFNVPMEAAVSKRRYQEYVIPRFVFYYMAADLTQATWRQMGNYTGRDHSTAIHGVKVVQDLIDTNKRFAAQMLDIRNALLDFFPNGAVYTVADATYRPRENDWFYALCMA